MRFRVTKTTDGKHVGQVFDVSNLSYETVKQAAGMHIEKTLVDGKLIHLINSNYRVTIEQIEE